MLAIIILALMGLTIYCILTAPQGYEDETEFHYGDDSEDFFK